MFLSKKAQVTLFVIIGFMILLAFIFVLSLKPAPKVNSGWDQDRVLQELKSGILKQHVDACLADISADGIEFLGQNGGYIYDFEGGKIPLQSLAEGVHYLNYSLGSKKILVAYGLRDNTFCPEVSYDYPNYPFTLSVNARKTFSEFNSVYTSNENCAFNNPSADYDGVLGQVTLPKMCAIGDASGCRSFAIGNVAGFTLEYQLQDYILSKLPTCIDFSEFEETIDAKIELEGATSVDVLLRDDDVFVKAVYPFKITYKNSVPALEVIEYSSYSKVRLGALYNYLYSILSKEARDPSFNIDATPYASSFYKSGFVFNKITDPCIDCTFPTSKHDIVEVYDTESVVKGKSFLFRAAVQNRRPVLQYVGNRDYDLNSNLPPEERSVSANISIFAIDPDDSQLKYTFLSEGYGAGWREHIPEDEIWLQTMQEPKLNLFLKVLNDFGTHPVAVLVEDADGYFDYELFNISVIDESLASDINPRCTSECEGSTFKNNGGNCDDWCWIASNSCSSYCQNVFFTENSECNLCANTAYFSKDKEIHPVACSSITLKDDCKSLMPDCFWITQKSSSSVSESCIDDSDFYHLAKDSAIS